jgi:membrane fusion protein (multidrug efflux system)
LIVVAVFISIAGSKSRFPPPPPGPSEVEVVQVEQRDVPIYSEWIGTLDGMVNAEVKAQVSGYLLSKNYTEGSFVKKGQLLFEIDPRPLQAAVDQAKGDLARAEGQLSQARGQLFQAQAQVAQAQANQGKTQLDENRFTGLVEDGVVSKEQYDNAVQANLAARAQLKAANAGVETATAGIKSAEAVIEASRAAVQSALLNLGFTRIKSPIDGIAGIASAQVGNLVSPTSDPLTTVSTVDPIKVYFTVNEQEYLSNSRNRPTQRGQESAYQRLDLELILSDSTTYPAKGEFFVADRAVDERTGAIRMAGVFPNPQNILRPGQYARVRAVTDTRTQALLIPQRAVTELQGSYQVAVVDQENRVAIRPVKVGTKVETMWIIEDGLSPEDRVIVEGTQKVRQGDIVSPKPFTTEDLSSVARP